MYRGERTSPIGSTGRIVAPGAVRVYLGVERSNNNASGNQGIGVDFKKDFPSNPSSFTFANQSSFQINNTPTTVNLTVAGVGVYHAVTGTGVAYIYETLTIS